MHIVDRRLNPGGKSLANRQRFLRRAKALVQRAVRDASARREHQGHRAGRRGLDPARRRARAALPATAQRRHARSRPARQQGLRRRRHASRGRRAAAAAAAREGSPDGGGEDDFRFVLTREEFLDLFLDDLELPDLAKRRLVAAMRQPVWRRAGYSVSGSPANLALPRTMRNSLSRRIALRRPKPRRDRRRSRRRSRRSRSGGDPEPARGAAATNWTMLGSAAPAHPLHRSDRPALPPLRADPAARRAGGDVLPDGRLGLDDRAHEGPRQALLHAALHLPDAPLPARRDRLHPPHRTRPRRSTRRRSSTAARPAAPWSRPRSRRCSASSRSAIRPEDWNIYAAQASDGDNALERQRARPRALLTRRILPVCQYFAYLEVGREDERGAPGFVRATATCGGPTSAIAKPSARIAMRKVRHRREIYPGVPRAVPAQDARRGGGRRAMSDVAAERPLLFEGADWDFDTIQRIHDAVEAIARRRARRSTSIRTRSR